MLQSFLKLLMLASIWMLFVLSISAQTNTIEGCQYIDNIGGKKPISDHLRKRMIKLCIEAKKKEYEELVKNSEELAKLSNEIETSFEKHQKLSSKDKQKLKQVDKLLKKIRKELSASDDDEDDVDDEAEKPSDTFEAIKQLKTKTENLLIEVKKTTRHTISTAAIQGSNAVLKIVKFLRFNN